MRPSTDLLLRLFLQRAAPGRRMLLVSPTEQSAEESRAKILATPGAYPVDNYAIVNGATIDFRVPKYNEPKTPPTTFIIDDPFGE